MAYANWNKPSFVRMGAGPVRKATTGIMESWRARVHTVFLAIEDGRCSKTPSVQNIFSGRFFEPSRKALAVKKQYIGKYQDKSTAFVASPPSARLFLDVQQRPRVGVFTHQRATLAGLNTLRDSMVYIYWRCRLPEGKIQLVRKEHCVVANCVPVVNAVPGSYAIADKR